MCPGMGLFPRVLVPDGGKLCSSGCEICSKPVIKTPPDLPKPHYNPVGDQLRRSPPVSILGMRIAVIVIPDCVPKMRSDEKVTTRARMSRTIGGYA